jgi:hypothetical protein
VIGGSHKTTPLQTRGEASLVFSHVKAAILLVAGNAAAGTVSTEVAALTEGGLKTMFVTKLKMATVVLLTLSVIGLTATVIPYRALASEQGGATNDAAPKTTAKDGEKEAKDAEKQKADAAEKSKAEGRPVIRGQKPDSAEKSKAEGQPAVPAKPVIRGKKTDAAFIMTAGTHKLWDGKWTVEVTRVEVPKDHLQVEFTRPDGKWIVFNRTFSEKWPWFVYAPSADMAMFYDGDKEMNLLTISDKGRILGKSATLPKEWVDQLVKLRPPLPRGGYVVGSDGKVRMVPLPPGSPEPDFGAKDGKVVPPPKK